MATTPPMVGPGHHLVDGKTLPRLRSLRREVAQRRTRLDARHQVVTYMLDYPVRMRKVDDQLN